MSHKNEQKAPTSFNLSLDIREKIERFTYHSRAKSKSELVEEILKKYFEQKGDIPPIPDSSYKI